MQSVRALSPGWLGIYINLSSAIILLICLTSNRLIEAAWVGYGFTVIADETKKLAKTTFKVTNEIRDVVDTFQVETEITQYNSSVMLNMANGVQQRVEEMISSFTIFAGQAQSTKPC